MTQATNAQATSNSLSLLQAPDLLQLPEADAPAFNPFEPARSFKVDFSDRTQWFVSTDGGLTKSPTNSSYIVGAVCDLQLQISKAKHREGYDYRLRVAFFEPDGTLSELNLNAINITQFGEEYVTSPARSLTGALLAISEAEEDMAALCAGCRFSIKPGKGRGVFVNADIAHGNRWISMASPSNTNRVSKTTPEFIAELNLIKVRFRGAKLLLTSAAVSGETPETVPTIDASSIPF